LIKNSSRTIDATPAALPSVCLASCCYTTA